MLHKEKDKNLSDTNAIVGTAVSDQNGYYQVSYHRKFTKGYVLRWQSDQKAFFEKEGVYDLHHKRTGYTILMSPVAYVKFRINKKSDSNRYVQILAYSKDGSPLPVIKSNYKFDTIIQKVVPLPAAAENYIHWFLFPGQDLHTDKVIASTGDTLVHLIEIE